MTDGVIYDELVIVFGDTLTAFNKKKSTIYIHNKRINIEFVKNKV